MKKKRFAGAALTVTLLLGCATNHESVQRQQMEGTRKARAESHRELESPPTHSENAARKKTRVSAKADGLGRYLAMAMEDSPELEASFEQWRASVLRISRDRRLPDPTISFSYFVSSVETRVGPQRAKIGVSQTFPWPTRLTAGADAASARARALQSQLDALTLMVRQKVATAYYRLWLIRATREIHAAHLEVVRSLSQSVLARVATGAANLAEQQQVDLSAARLEDMLAGMDEAEAAAVAQLRAAVGNRTLGSFDTRDAPPEAAVPRESESALAEVAVRHPLLLSMDYEALAFDEMARAEEAVGLPSFSLGADWIITGEASAPNIPDSGKDALMVGGAISVPLWRGSYSDAADASRAEASATRARRDAAENQVVAELHTAYAEVRDATRRAQLHQSTLVPQADSAYASVLGAYITGQGTVAQTILAQKDLLELRGSLAKARADHAIAWARLEHAVGRPVKPGESAEIVETPQ